jgi:sigma-E factor negative regulatory protein RseA
MSTDSKEHLSELMDGEIGGDTGRFVLRRLEVSAELRETWARYHLIRDCMRYQDRGLAGEQLCARVRTALDGASEPAHEVRRASGSRWLRPAAGFAVAATVAMMAVFAVAPNLPDADGVEVQQAALPQSQPFTSPNIPARGPSSRQVNLNGGDEGAATRKMNSYLLRHYQVAGSSAGNGFVSFVPIVISKSATQEAANSGAESKEPSQNESDPGNP